MKRLASLLSFFCAIATAIVGHTIHHSIFWSTVDFLFWPLAWAKWLICAQVNVTIIKSAFAFFLS